MNPFEMVVLIVAIGAVASIIRAKYGLPDRSCSSRSERRMRRRGHYRDDEADAARAEESRAHGDEVRMLKERIAVLERIVTDQNSSGANLEREIEALRHRD